MNLRSLDDWLGPQDSTILDPTAIEFNWHPARTCAGCMFAGQRSPVCKIAGAEAVRRGIPDCDAGVIYVAVEKDARQLDLLASSQ